MDGGIGKESKKIPTRDRNQVKSHAQNIGIDVKERIIRDHSIYKQGKKKTEQKNLSINKHHDESTKEDSASIIDKITMSSDDGIADKGDGKTAETSGVEKLNNIDDEGEEMVMGGDDQLASNTTTTCTVGGEEMMEWTTSTVTSGKVLAGAA